VKLDPAVGQGTMLGEHYRIERELGHGGMATVYLCTDIRDGLKVAVKVLRRELESVVTKERFFREIAFSTALDHPRVPRVLESGSMGGVSFYAMDYVDGEPLRDIMKKRGRIPVEEAVDIAVRITEPMSVAHSRGIVHRDIKPENILLKGSDVYILDFGVARALIDSTGDRLTRTGLTVGTPTYMSPEQITAERDIDLRSDIYSLGCVVYEMMSGVPPFRGANPQMVMAARFTTPPRPLRGLIPDIPLSVDTAVLTAVQKEVSKRWQTAEEFATALQAHRGK
jgi:serine/threonine-protein kinase